MSLNINKINSLLCLFEKASSLTVNDGCLISEWEVGDRLEIFDENEILIDINWDSEGLFYECQISAQSLSDSIIKNGIITCKDLGGEDVDICLFKISKLIDSGEELALTL